jgi:hypothetical protein
LTAAATATTDYAAATGNPQGFSISQAAATISISNLPTSAAYNGSFTPTFTYSGNGTPTYTVTSNSPSYCSVGANNLVSFIGIGSCSLTAAATATTDYAAATGNPQGFSISQAASQIASLISSLNPVAPDTSVKFTATVSSSAGTPTGTVTFIDNSVTTLGQGNLLDGVATLTTSFTSAQAGSNSITAVYSGDTNFRVSNSGAFTENVIAFTIAPGSGSVTTQTVSAGGTATYSMSIAPSSGTTFPEAVTLTVSGMPSGATATITPSTWTQLTSTSWSLPANTALSAISLTIKLPATAAIHDQGNATGRTLPPVLWGLLLLPFGWKLRRAGKRMGRMIALVLLLTASLAAVTAVGGCGGSSGGGGGSQSSSYTITATATAGTVSKSTTFTLVVN